MVVYYCSLLDQTALSGGWNAWDLERRYPLSIEINIQKVLYTETFQIIFFQAKKKFENMAVSND